MPSGAGSGGVPRFSTVGAKATDPAASAAAGFARRARTASTAAPPITTTVTNVQMPRLPLMRTTLLHLFEHLVQVEARCLLSLGVIFERGQKIGDIGLRGHERERVVQ